MEFDAKFVAYVSPYLVLKNGGEYTKHIYAGAERIASKIGDFGSFGADPRRVEKAGESIRKINYKDKYDALGEQLAENYDTFNVECNLKENKDYEDNKSFCCDENGNMPNLDEAFNGEDATHSGYMGDSTQHEGNIFFYHPDHLGSTSLVTNLDGEVTQHVAYIPYGEVFIEERNGVWNTPYLFNAKELDEETGLYYYGARYLNPKDTRWLSVDPMFEKYVGMTPYKYCAGNPIRLVDPNGLEEDESIKQQLQTAGEVIRQLIRGGYSLADIAIGIEYHAGIEGGAIAKGEANLVEGSVMFLGGADAGYVYTYGGGESGCGVVTNAEAGVQVGASVFVAVNYTNPGDHAGDHAKFDGLYSYYEAGMDVEMPIGIGVSGSFSVAKGGDWMVYSMTGEVSLGVSALPIGCSVTGGAGRVSFSENNVGSPKGFFQKGASLLRFTPAGCTFSNIVGNFLK